MARLESLTESQRARFPEFVKKWTDIGLCTEPADRARAEEGLRWMYRHAQLSDPRIVWCGSPLSNALVRMIVQNIATSHPIVGPSVWDSVWASVGASVGAIVAASVRASVRASVGASVRARVAASVRDSVWDSVYGQHEAFWLGYYDFFRTVCHFIPQTDPLGGLWALCRSAGWALPHKNMCWVSERPHTLHRQDSRLHREGGLALQYPDGWGIHALWGVRVEPWMAEPPAEQLDVSTVLQVQNVAVRTACIKRIGIERLIQKIGARTLDTWQAYTLLEVSINEQPCRYLKMKNPSVDVWHVEGVPNSCQTVADALHSRKPEALAALPIDDEHGEDWYAQGDVAVWPKRATAVKRYPRIHT